MEQPSQPRSAVANSTYSNPAPLPVPNPTPAPNPNLDSDPTFIFDGFGKAYIPFQNLYQLYPPASGLARGTIFPELDQPYQSKANVNVGVQSSRQSQSGREVQLEQLAAADFMLADMALYLDTHPTDQSALNVYAGLMQTAKQLRATYEAQYGSLTARYTVPAKTWTWVAEPWPWNYEANYELSGV